MGMVYLANDITITSKVLTDNSKKKYIAIYPFTISLRQKIFNPVLNAC